MIDSGIGHGEELRLAAQSGEQGAVGAGEPGLGFETQKLVEQRGAPFGVEMGGDLVEEHQRGRAARGGQQPRLRQQNGDSSSAFCSPVEHCGAGMPLPTCSTTRSERCGP